MKQIKANSLDALRAVTVGEYHPDVIESSQLCAYAKLRLVNAAPDLLKVAKAYYNHLQTCAATDGEVATYHHIGEIIAYVEKE